MTMRQNVEVINPGTNEIEQVVYQEQEIKARRLQFLLSRTIISIMHG